MMQFFRVLLTPYEYRHHLQVLNQETGEMESRRPTERIDPKEELPKWLLASGINGKDQDNFDYFKLLDVAQQISKAAEGYVDLTPDQYDRLVHRIRTVANTRFTHKEMEMVAQLNAAESREG